MHTIQKSMHAAQRNNNYNTTQNLTKCDNVKRDNETHQNNNFEHTTTILNTTDLDKPRDIKQMQIRQTRIGLDINNTLLERTHDRHQETNALTHDTMSHTFLNCDIMPHTTGDTRNGIRQRQSMRYLTDNNYNINQTYMNHRHTHIQHNTTQHHQLRDPTTHNKQQTHQHKNTNTNKQHKTRAHTIWGTQHATHHIRTQQQLTMT